MLFFPTRVYDLKLVIDRKLEGAREIQRLSAELAKARHYTVIYEETQEKSAKTDDFSVIKNGVLIPAD